MDCAITGGRGFLGWHLRCRLRAAWPDITVRVLGRGDLDHADALAQRIKGCDVVFHLAGANTHDVDDAQENVALAEALGAAIGEQADAPRVVYSNSAHVERDTPYGHAKQEALTRLRSWAARSGGTVADVVLPNLFGEQGRPDYNSAVANFCHAVVRREPVEVNQAGCTELLHAQDAAAALVRNADAGGPEHERVRGEVIEVPALYERISRLYEVYAGSQRVPPLPTRLDVRLFNQVRDAMFPEAYPVALDLHTDARGSFFEAVRAAGRGQTSFSTTAPGVTRGDHWHFDKVERFLVLQGDAIIRIRRMFDDAVHSFEVSGDRPAFVDMPTLHTHSITNVGADDLLTMFWSNDHFDPEAPDTLPEPVLVGGGAR